MGSGIQAIYWGGSLVLTPVEGKGQKWEWAEKNVVPPLIPWGALKLEQPFRVVLGWAGIMRLR